MLVNAKGKGKKGKRGRGTGNLNKDPQLTQAAKDYTSKVNDGHGATPTRLAHTQELTPQQDILRCQNALKLAKARLRGSRKRKEETAAKVAAATEKDAVTLWGPDDGSDS